MTSPQTPRELIERARELDVNATPGPWQTRFLYRVMVTVRRYANRFGLMCSTDARADWADAEFSAESRTVMPVLANALEQANRERDEMLARAIDAEHDVRARKAIIEVLKRQLEEQYDATEACRADWQADARRELEYERAYGRLARAHWLTCVRAAETRAELDRAKQLALAAEHDLATSRLATEATRIEADRALRRVGELEAWTKVATVERLAYLDWNAMAPSPARDEAWVDYQNARKALHAYLPPKGTP